MGNRSVKVLSESTPTPLKRGKSLPAVPTSLRNAKTSKERLSILKRRMSVQVKGREPRKDFKPSTAKLAKDADAELTKAFAKVSVKDDNVIVTPEYLCGKLHDYRTLPFESFKPGVLMDLETCWTITTFPTLAWSIIQQIGACGIGNEKGDFDVCCLLPIRDYTRDNIPIISTPTNVQMFKDTLATLKQNHDNSFHAWMHCAGIKQSGSKQAFDSYKNKYIQKYYTEEDEADFIRLYMDSWLFWEEEENKRTVDIPLGTIAYHKLKFQNEKGHKTLLFPIEYALRLFMSYCGENPIWYAHNGNKFDYPIMEKWFRILGLNYYCQPERYDAKTTAMDSYRKKEVWTKYLVFDINKTQLTNQPWPKEDRKKITCYDTYLEIPKNKKSKYHGREGALRYTQRDYGWCGEGLEPPWPNPVYTKRSLKKGAKDVTEYKWPDGSTTTTLYSFKLQDLCKDNGIKGNDPSAHTALADCWTLRELLYRVFESEKAEDSKVSAKLKYLF